MAYKLIDAEQARWQVVYEPHLIAPRSARAVSTKADCGSSEIVEAQADFGFGWCSLISFTSANRLAALCRHSMVEERVAPSNDDCAREQFHRECCETAVPMATGRTTLPTAGYHCQLIFS